jgi:hypothetical protein
MQRGECRVRLPVRLRKMVEIQSTRRNNMKEIFGTARNFYNSDCQNGTMPVVEWILVLSEPEYRVENDKVVKVRVPNTVRIAMHRDTVRALLKELVEIDGELEAREAKLPTVDNKEKI